MKAVFYLALCSACYGMNVMIVTPSVMKSEQAVVVEVMNALTERGHTVTAVLPFPLTGKHQRVEDIILSEIELINKNIEVKDEEMKKTSVLFNVIEVLFSSHAEVFWSDPRILELWHRRKEFDLFVGMSYYSEYIFPFLMDFPGPFVQICSPGAEAVSLSREGNWLSPSVFPSFISHFDLQMTFWERVINLPLSVQFYWKQNGAIDEYIKPAKKRFPDMEHYSSYYDRVALTLINGHFALDGPVPLLPSQIEIGTINAMKPKPLPKDLEDFVQGSGKAGVIYFSLGSIAKSTDIPQAAKEMFVEAFKMVPQRVLWKYEGTDLKLPPNVKSQSWMPQQDILGHPKTRVYISHCGNLGTQEAKYHGVPVLGVPIAFDQPRNAARMERKGYAVVLQWETLTTDQIVSSLNKLINDTSYKERLEAVSRVLQDQKDTPAERAVWWLEYVVRHKGAPHLRYAGRRLSLFQYIMLDVILFWSVVLFAVLFTVGYIIKRLCCGGKKEKRDAQRKKKTQ